ncbi:hypothetical protein ACFIOY_35455 [Bradyrhizobium sp. TZ2]
MERIAKSYNLALSRDDLTSFRNLMDGVLASYRRLDQFAEPTLAVKYPRDVGFRQGASDNLVVAGECDMAIGATREGRSEFLAVSAERLATCPPTGLCHTQVSSRLN